MKAITLSILKNKLFNAVCGWWRSLENCEQELAKQGIYPQLGYFGQTVYIPPKSRSDVD